MMSSTRRIISAASVADSSTACLTCVSIGTYEVSDGVMMSTAVGLEVARIDQHSEGYTCCQARVMCMTGSGKVNHHVKLRLSGAADMRLHSPSALRESC